MTTTQMHRVLAALVLAFALAACGGSGGSSSASSGSGGESAQPGAVTIADLAYDPADLSVATGTQVTWTNDDDATHTVTFDDSSVESSGQMKKGDTFSATFDEAGTYSYVCAVHPDMKAKVTVQ